MYALRLSHLRCTALPFEKPSVPPHLWSQAMLVIAPPVAQGLVDEVAATLYRRLLREEVRLAPC